MGDLSFLTRCDINMLSRHFTSTLKFQHLTVLKQFKQSSPLKCFKLQAFNTACEHLVLKCVSV